MIFLAKSKFYGDTTIFQENYFVIFYDFMSPSRLTNACQVLI